MLQKTGPLGGLLQYMNYLQKGLAVHADNLSRTDLPGAQAKELKPFSAQVHAATPSHVHTTNPLHLSSKSSIGGNFAMQKTQANTESLSGNSINREEEISKVNNLTTEYLKATRLYQKGLSMMRTILGAKG